MDFKAMINCQVSKTKHKCQDKKPEIKEIKWSNAKILLCFRSGKSNGVYFRFDGPSKSINEMKSTASPLHCALPSMRFVAI